MNIPGVVCGIWEDDGTHSALGRAMTGLQILHAESLPGDDKEH